MNKRLLTVFSTGFFRGLGAISQLILIWCVSQLMAKDETGRFVQYLSGFTVLTPLLLLGTQHFGMRQISRFSENESVRIRATAHRAARLSLMTLATVFVPLLLFGVLADGYLRANDPNSIFAGMLTPLAIASGIGGVCLTAAAHFHGTSKLSLSLVLSHIGIPLTCVAVLFVVSPVTSDHAIESHLVACVLAAAAAVLVWISYFGRRTPSPFFRFEESAFRVSRDLWLINALILTVNWFPLLIAGVLLLPAEVADLNVGQRFANLINFVLIIINFVFAPRMRHAWGRDDRYALRQDVAKCAQFLFMAGTAVFVVVMVGAGYLPMLFGPEYIGAVLFLRIFAIGQYFNVVTGSVNQILTMWGYEKKLRNICAVSAVTAVVLSTILATSWGAWGIAAATAIALSLQNVLAVATVRQKLGFWVFDLRSPAMRHPSGAPT